MRIAIILCALLCAAGILAHADIQQDVINRDPAGGGGGSGDTIDFSDTDGKFEADKIGPAIEELDDPNESGPNAPDGKVNWEQLLDVPEGFADGVDNVGSGGGDMTVKEADGSPSVSSVESIEFDQDGGFTVTDEGAGVVGIGLSLADENESGPNAGDGLVNWEQIINMPEGFADGTDADTDAFSDLADVSISDPSNGQVPVYSSGVWENVTPPFLSNGGTLTDGRLCTWNNTNSEIDCDATNAPSATALAANGTNCSEGQAARGVDASGNAEGCFTPEGGGGGGGSVTVEESDGSPSVSDVSTISFNQSQGFTVTDAGEGEAEVGLSLDAAQVTYGDNDNVYPTDNVGAAIEALRDTNESGPNATTGKVNWEQVMNMPEPFVDGQIEAAEVPYSDGGYPDVTTVEGALDALVNEPGDGPNSEDSVIPFENLKNVPEFRKTLLQLRPQGYEPPASSFATMNSRNAHPTLKFNGNVCAVWSFVMPNTYGGNGVTIDIWYVSTETSNDTDWDGSWERIATSQDIDSDSFASAISADNNSNNATSGIATKVSIAFTDGAQMDSCAADELCRFKLCRDDTSDTGGADTIDFLGGQIRETP